MQISQLYTNYFINKGCAASADVVPIIKEIQKAVFHATGIAFEPEIRIAWKN